MSAAATQAVSHTTPTLDSHAVSGTHQTGRQYHRQQSPQSRETRYTQQSSNTTTTSTSPRRSPRRSGRHAGPGSSSASSQHVQPNNAGGGSNASTPRNHPLPPSTYGSSAPSTSETSPVISYGGPSGQEHRSGPPIPPPPRTSSNQQNHHYNPPPSMSSDEVATSSRGKDGRPSSSRRPNTTEGHGRGDGRRGLEAGHASNLERERPKDDSTSAAAAAARSRRKGHRSPREEEPQRSSSTREPRGARSPHTGHARSTGVVGSPGEGEMPRESSTVINRVVVGDPVEDLERIEARRAEARPSRPGQDVTPVTGLGLVGSEGVDDGGRGGSRARHDHSTGHSRRKETRLGEYILGQTLGEGEFGKVKMGWKQDGGVQVAIKLIRRDSLGSNPSRLPKIHREISILRGLSHPNIVRLHEMVETERHIGIILEYASGGELFDYILNHRYLKDPSARRLFAQLVSGVGYLHKKGIVHRDLKLENLLLDKNRNIIITDFGFANTFDPADELGDEIEYNLTNRDFIKRMDLDRVRTNGYRRGDLMQTSCGSPCYAAPELVVSDSLYTGRKVDVWSCGVILYAMLAGYLPFDDDPANPEGDNINLLYKYIVSTPLTFPEYVTPHARDLLRRILVADPRKRADLFEVARHSWLNEYAHVVSFITSSTTTTGEISNATVTTGTQQEAPLPTRSASVREPAKSHQPHLTGTSPLSHKHDHEHSPSARPPRDAKRRTVQVEYVAPESQTARELPVPSVEAVPPPHSRARAGADGSVEQTAAKSKLSQVAQPYPGSTPHARSDQRPSSSTQVMGPPIRPNREVPRSASDSTGAFVTGASIARPNTGGSMTSTGSISGSMRLPSRGSYSRPGQPVAPTVAATNAQGRLAQPSGKQYVISNPIPQQDSFMQPSSYGRASTAAAAPPAMTGITDAGDRNPPRSHKRSNTVGGIGEKIFGRSTSLFGGRPQTQANQQQTIQKSEKSYPPTSMSGPIAAVSARPSIDSRRSTSFGFGRKNSSLQEKPRRFSFLPASFSLKNISGGSKDSHPPSTAHSMTENPDFGQVQRSKSKSKRPTMAFGRGLSQSTSGGTTDDDLLTFGGLYRNHKRATATQQARSYAAPTSNPQQKPPYKEPNYAAGRADYHQTTLAAPGESALTTESESSLHLTQQVPTTRYGGGGGAIGADANAYATDGASSQDQVRWDNKGGVPIGVGVGLQRPARKFVDAYEQEPDGRFGSSHGHHHGGGPGGGHGGGSSGAARKVMDFFRRRGKARFGDER